MEGMPALGLQQGADQMGEEEMASQVLVALVARLGLLVVHHGALARGKKLQRMGLQLIMG